MSRRARGFRGARWESRTGAHFNVIVVIYRMSLVLNAVVMASQVFLVFGESGVPTQLVGGGIWGSSPPPLVRGNSRIKRLTCSENYMVA